MGSRLHVGSTSRRLIISSDFDIDGSESDNDETDSKPTTPTPVGPLNFDSPIWTREGPYPQLAPVNTTRYTFPTLPSTATNNWNHFNTPIPDPLAVTHYVRATSLPAMSSDGPDHSSPIIGTAQQRLTIIRRKSSRKHIETMNNKKLDRLVGELETEAEGKAAIQKAADAKLAVLDGVLQTLTAHSIMFSDMMFHVFDPTFRQGKTRWDGFFKVPGSVKRILDLWVAKTNSPTA